MARTFNGTSQGMASASALSLSAYTSLTFACWYWWDAYASATPSGHLATYGPADGTVNTFRIVPNKPVGGLDIEAIFSSGPNVNDGYYPHSNFTGPLAAGTWTHLVVTYDRTILFPNLIMKLYLNGTLRTLTQNNVAQVENPWSNLNLFLMCYDTTQAYGAGRLAEVAIWGGTIFSDPQAADLYNGGAGKDATTSTAGSPTYYWQICGDVSPEPATTGGIALNLTGSPAKSPAHPISTCGGAPPPGTSERSADSRSIGVYSPRGTTQPIASGWA